MASSLHEQAHTPRSVPMTTQHTDFELLEVKRFRRALALTICESKLCFTCDTDAEHCQEVREEMERRLADAGK